MRNRYITTQIKLVCLSTPEVSKKNIHEQLAETIAERRKIMDELDRIRRTALIIQYLNFTQAA